MVRETVNIHRKEQSFMGFQKKIVDGCGSCHWPETTEQVSAGGKASPKWWALLAGSLLGTLSRTWGRVAHVQ